MNKKIFIGGTGRSGTMIVSKILGSHPEIYKMPIETRFIVDKGGMIDVFYSLTKNYSIDQSRMALEIFHNLMTNDLTNKFTAPYIGMNFNELFGFDTYNNSFNSFFEKLHYGEYIASDFHSEENLKLPQVLLGKNFGVFIRYYRSLYGRLTKKHNWPKESMYIGKYFSNEDQLLGLMGDFINKLFSSNANKNNKIHWCEDTPANIMHVDFLNKLTTDTYFIHVVRNPIAVAASMKNRFWAPNTIENIVFYLKNMYEKLIQVRNLSNLQSINYMEIKLEDMINDLDESKGRIANFLSVSNQFDNSLKLDPAREMFFLNMLSKHEYEFLERELGKYRDFYYQ